MDFVPVTIVCILIISQIIVGICVLASVTQIEWVAYIGVALMLSQA
jgi:hypothetical protein